MYKDERTEVLGKELYDKHGECLKPIPKFSCDMYKDERTRVLGIEQYIDVRTEVPGIEQYKDDRTEVLGMEQTHGEKLKELIDKREELLKSIPKFWSRAFMAHPILARQLNNKDREIFDEYLNSIKVEDNQDAKSGYSITFNFDENPYFDNPSLAKSLTFHEGKLKEAKATTIQWKEGKSMPDEVPESDDDNEVCPEKDDELVYEAKLTDWSFFNWLSSSWEQNEISFPDQVADLIKNKLWIDPFKYLPIDLVETDEDGEYQVV